MMRVGFLWSYLPKIPESQTCEYSTKSGRYIAYIAAQNIVLAKCAENVEIVNADNSILSKPLYAAGMTGH